MVLLKLPPVNRRGFGRKKVTDVSAYAVIMTAARLHATLV